MADLLVVTGPPGAGKSTVAALVVQAFEPAALVPGDAFFGFWTQGAVAPWLPEAEAQNTVVLRAAAVAAGEYVRAGCSVVYDGVIGPWYLSDFVAAARLPDLQYAMLMPPLEECLARVTSRVGHGFTDLAAAEHMHAQFSAAEVDERHVLRTAALSAADTAELLLARWARGELLRRG